MVLFILTSPRVLPLWVAPEAVGVRLLLPRETDVYRPFGDGTHTSFAEAVGRAVLAAHVPRRFFRSLLQRLASWSCFKGVTLAACLLTHAECLAYEATITRMAESNPSSSGGAHLTTPQRALRADSTLQLLKEFSVPCKQTVALAQNRLEWRPDGRGDPARAGVYRSADGCGWRRWSCSDIA